MSNESEIALRMVVYQKNDCVHVVDAICAAELESLVAKKGLVLT